MAARPFSNTAGRQVENKVAAKQKIFQVSVIGQDETCFWTGRLVDSTTTPVDESNLFKQMLHTFIIPEK